MVKATASEKEKKIKESIRQKKERIEGGDGGDGSEQIVSTRHRHCLRQQT